MGYKDAIISAIVSQSIRQQKTKATPAPAPQQKDKVLININETNIQVFSPIYRTNNPVHLQRLYMVLSSPFNVLRIEQNGKVWYKGNSEYYENLGYLVRFNDKYSFTLLDVDADSFSISIDYGIVIDVLSIQGYELI